MKEKLIEFAEDSLYFLDDVISNLSEGQEMLIKIAVSILASAVTVLVATGRLGM